MMMFENFCKGNIKLLVVSDVVVCGLDIFEVSYVFNYDILINVEDYVYCIGCIGCVG